MRAIELKKFIDENSKNHLCKYFNDVDTKVQKAMIDVYGYCFRLSIFKCQTLAILDSIIKPFLTEEIVKSERKYQR